MKKLPIGIQSIKKLIEKQFIYVDKTLFAKTLIDTGDHYFLSRPRRFGKSLFLDTLREIFLGNKELFKGYYIHDSDYLWKSYPVLHFSFGRINNSSAEQLRKDLTFYVEEFADQFNLQLIGDSLEFRLASLIKKLGQKQPVVILIDEYDKPILDHLQDPALVEANKAVLRGFFSCIKDMDSHIKFTFITGISRFSRASLFSGFNNLKDISLDSRYAELMGYTQEELEHNFQEHIQAIADKDSSFKEVLKAMKKWYNGYLFSKTGKRVYNPFSTLSFLDTGDAAPYWYNTGTPSFLMKQIAKKPSFSIYSHMEILFSELADIIEIEDINPATLMYQAGYLTINSYHQESNTCTLDFPNEEVRKAFYESLFKSMTSTLPREISQLLISSKKALEEENLEVFFKNLSYQFCKIPYSIFEKAKESFYHGLFLMCLELMGIPTRGEVLTSNGRIDLVSQSPTQIIITEIKVDKSAQDALDQIKEKEYLKPYFNQEKKLIALGLNFSSEKRDISEWRAELYSSCGKFIKEIS